MMMARMMHYARRGIHRIAVIVLIAVMALSLVAPTARAAEDAPPPKAEKGSGGKKSAPKIYQVEDMPGDYFQLEASWVPVMAASGKIIYQSMVLRLYPEDEERSATCALGPKVEEDLMIWFNDNIISMEVFNTPAKLEGYVNTIALKRLGEHRVKKIEVMTIFKSPDSNSEVVSRACK